MPRRVVQHERETRSQTAFEAKLPAVWAPRRLPLDYGLDYQVEIFADDGSHTGDAFYVQLKARGEEDVTKALRLWFEHDDADYFRRQGLPVLIVVHHVPTDSLYARWFHSFDPHYGGVHKKGVTFQLDPERDKWGDKTPDRLAADVRGFRRWRGGHVSLPVSFGLEVTDDSDIHGMSASEVLLAVRTTGERASSLIRFLPEASNDHPLVRMSPSAVSVDFQGVTSVTTHAHYDLASARQVFPYDVLVTIALGFHQVGDVNTAARLLRMFAGEAGLLEDPEVLFRSVGCFVQSHRVLDALRLSEHLRRRTDLEAPVGDLMAMASLAQAPAMSPEDVEDVGHYLRDVAEKADTLGDPAEARVAHYNLANWAKSNRRWDEAFFEYWRAAEWDPTYPLRPYFCSEFAAVLFMLGEYEHAAASYRSALDGGEDVRHLLADALVHAGRYQDGVEAFDAYLQNCEGAPAWCRLKRSLVNDLSKRAGVTSQQRQPDEAMKVAQIEGVVGDVVEAQLHAALQLDFLCPLAWFNLGVRMHRQGDEVNAFQAFAMTGLLETGDAESWCNATLIALGSEALRPLFETVVQAAYESLGVKYIDRFRDFLHEQPADGFPVGDVLRVVEEVLRSIPRRPRGFDIRFLLDDERYESIRVD